MSMRRRAVRFGAGWYGFNRDPAATKGMLDQLDAAFAKAGRKRGDEFQIIVTPPVAMPMDAMQAYVEVGVDRLVVNLGSQRPERVDQRMAEIAKLVKLTG
jgi:alkanesulfonate monooxygenase SsuD/methylene tetrahydromethanopterin reductase-like flavin-dependent oxidoreductase (luciferase family)